MCVRFVFAQNNSDFDELLNSLSPLFPVNIILRTRIRYCEYIYIMAVIRTNSEARQKI